MKEELKEISEKIIGRGTWYDKIALEILERERKLSRSLDLVRVESGVAASGIPHVGSFAEVTRNYAVSLALKEQGVTSEFIVFSDNKDGLRKVPTGLPKSLEKYVGHPVKDVPDPFGCHGSYGDHMVHLLLESLEKCGIEYTFMSADEIYKKGKLNNEIRTLLENSKKVGEIVREETGQEKYLASLPYFPICSSCGRIYTSRAYGFLPKEGRVLYSCEGMEIKGKWLEGCGHKGEADYTKGEGKLGWKAGEFAARWRALGIRFEAYGKDISDSVRVNDRICREILGYEPPMHVQYEMFLDKSGKKISKSVGNIFTPQVWFRYGSPQSMILLTLKRFAGTRNISVTDIPHYVNELGQIEEVYFGRKRIEDEKEKFKLKGLFEYCWFLKPPAEPGLNVPYNLLTFLVKVAPSGSETDFILEKLREYGYKELILGDIKNRIEYASNWVRDFGEITETNVELSSEQRTAIAQLIQTIQSKEDPEEIQSAVFEIAKQNGLKPKDFFRIIYTILLGVPSGPRLGPYLITMGKENVVAAIKRGMEKVAASN